ncbi:DeoR/GlpR family DNA-binding transcription regulator [Rubellicoccus peritrichatus]|uniref:DeoR/GlpR family DNA-binding transcription regulator n=1 Tax=Rubellicoccus peritrichatus TaxID=3080537 RepID=A0AAQ3QSP5_9BACT|nr:DeoR/GlpR family DNA-binding transcription regulator [Puniceicoccus sp. CR14]WOO42743.1 DeoR/GlpR family DNA-binding transcription regulator [Puniceicoccus sp. CR14]
MEKTERHERILHLAGERGTIFLKRAVEATGASLPTIRRDFQELEDAGAVERIRGGIRVRRKDGNVSFDLRAVQQSKAKSSIARKAASLLQSGDVIFIDGGTTTNHICFHLPQIPLRIITNSLRLSAYLDDASNQFPEWEVYLTGGKIQHGSNMLAGPGTVHTLDFYHADWAFLSVGGITADGLYNTSEAIVETERKMIERADRSVILADQNKIGKRAMCRVCGLNPIDRLITNKPEGRSLVEEEMQEKNLMIIHVD